MDMLRRMPGPGPIALIGSGEFLPVMNEIDASLLATTGRHRPRVVILPTASWPDGEDVFRRWAALGSEHFGALGAEVEPLLVRDRFDAVPLGRQAGSSDGELVGDAGGGRDRGGS
jgi:hypothetical protein